MRSSCRAARFWTAGFVAAALIASREVRADVSWNVPSGDWSVPSNWGGTLPTGSDTAYIVNGGTVAITLPGELCGTLSLGSSAGSGTLQMTGGSLSATSTQYVGYSGTGTFLQCGGTNSIAGSYGALLLGYTIASNGTYNLSSSGQLSAPLEYVGYSGTGTFTQSGGTNTTGGGFGEICVGTNTGSIGMYNLGGNGQVSAFQEIVGVSGTGNFTQSGGSNSMSSNSGLYIGNDAGSSGTYNLSGNAQLSASNDYVGYYGTGTVTQSGGTNSISNGLYLGSYSGSSGTYSLSGNAQLSASNECIGSAGGGTFTQSGGTNNISNSLYLGNNAGISGAYSLSGNAQLSASNEYVGSPGMGIFTQSGGTNSISNSLNVGNNVGSSGTYSLSGNAQVSASIENVGNVGVGAFTQSGGINIISNFLSLGGNIGSNGTYILSGSGQLFAVYEYLGAVGIGSFTQSGGTNSVTYLMLGQNNGSGPTYNLNGGVLVLASLASLGGVGGTFNFTGGTLQASSGFSSSNLVMTLGTSGGRATFDTAGFTVTLSDGLRGSGSLTKVGSGTLLLSGFNTYAGGTAVNAGTLQVAGTASLPGYTTPGTITVGNGAMLTVSAGGSGWTAASIGALLGGNGSGFANGSALGIDTTGGSLAYASNLSGNMGLVKLGSNALTLSAADTYKGNTLISGGTLALGSSLALQQGTLDSSGSGTLSFGSLTAATFGGLTGPGTLLLTNSSSAPVTIQVGNNGASTTFSGALNGPGSLTKVGSGTLLLSGSNTYTGGTTVTTGTLALGSSLTIQDSTLNLGATGVLNVGGLASVTFGGLAGAGNISLTNTAGTAVALSVGADNSSTTYSGVLSDNATGAALNKFGAGTLTLTGSNTYTGPTTISSGTLQIGNGGSGAAIGGTSRVTDNAGLVFDHGDAVTVNAIISGSGGLTQTGSGTLVLMNLNSYSGPTTISGGTLEIDNGGSSGTLGSGPIADNAALVFARSDSGLVVSNVISGSGNLTQIGAGTLTLAATNLYTGNTLVSAGTLALGNSLAIQDSTFNTSGSGALSFGGLASVTFGGLAGNGNLLLTNTAGTAVALSVGANNSSTTCSGVLSDNASGAALNKFGAGTLTLTGSNTCTGPTTISGGTLQIGNGGSGAAIGGTSGVTDNAGLVFNHGDVVTFNPIIGGSGGLTQTGSGTLVLMNLNSYSGPTTISGGTLQIDNGGSSGTLGSGPVTDNAALVFARNDNGAVVSNVISGSGSLTQIGAGTLTLAATNVYTGNTLISAGTLALGNSLAIQDSTFNTSGFGALSFGGLASATFGGLTGGGNLILTNTAGAAVALWVGATIPARPTRAC